MRIKRFISMILSVVLAVLSLSGCEISSEDDQNTLTINYGIRNIDIFIEGLTKQFPDINFVIEPSYCSNQSSYLRKTLTTGNASDIFYYTHKPDMREAADFLLDLSGYDFISNYDRSIINSYLSDGHIYCVPGPVLLRGMAYNKTLFERHGWKRPESHEELVALCRQIRAETDDIAPIAMSMGGLAYPFSLVTTLSQAGFLGTPAGEAWENRFKSGEASVSEGWGEGLSMTAELIDAGAFKDIEKYIGIWDGDACNMDFAEGKAAMFVMWAGQADMLKMIEAHPDYEYAFMPFFGKEAGQLTIGANPSSVWGISKRLSEPGNEKKLQNALRVMEWFSTPEAQEIMKSYITDEEGNLKPTAAEMSPLVSSEEDKESSPYFIELWEQADKGNKMSMIYSGYESVIIDAGTVIQEAMLLESSENMTRKFIAAADEDYKDFLSGGEGAALCNITKDFTRAESAQLLANGIHEANLGDLVLMTQTGRTREGVENRIGAGARYFEGTITNQDYNIVLGSLKNLQILSLTGKQIKELISNGKRITSEKDSGLYADFPYYWSGIDVKLSSSKKVISAKLNGKELEDNAVYKVVFCLGDYTEETAAAGDPSDSGINLAEYWLQYVTNKKELSPPEVLRK